MATRNLTDGKEYHVDADYSFQLKLTYFKKCPLGGEGFGRLVKGTIEGIAIECWKTSLFDVDKKARQIKFKGISHIPGDVFKGHPRYDEARKKIENAGGRIFNLIERKYEN
ncbi:hypothetical protein KAT80_01750 [Candidatus Pacearchaeota archaeon]|nr:hypothetical protein [Candidatus Pacearchaeota archaeon]